MKKIYQIIIRELFDSSDKIRFVDKVKAGLYTFAVCIAFAVYFMQFAFDSGKILAFILDYITREDDVSEPEKVKGLSRATIHYVLNKLRWIAKLADEEDTLDEIIEYADDAVATISLVEDKESEDEIPEFDESEEELIF